MTTISEGWEDSKGNPDGAISSGIGYTIAWQRGALRLPGDAGGLEPRRNGAFLIEVLEACKEQLDRVNSGKFACEENYEAEEALTHAIFALKSRLNRRQEEGTLGTHQVDK